MDINGNENHHFERGVRMPAHLVRWRTTDMALLPAFASTVLASPGDLHEASVIGRIALSLAEIGDEVEETEIGALLRLHDDRGEVEHRQVTSAVRVAIVFTLGAAAGGLIARSVLRLR